MTAVDGISKPFNYPVSASLATLSQEGIVLKKDTGNTLTLITAKGDLVHAVLDQAFVDSSQTAKTTVSGDRVPVFWVGSGAVVRVASVTTITWAFGEAAYLSDTVDGMVTNVAATSRPIGHYVGEGETTTASGDLVNVLLDVAVGASTV